MEVEEVFKDVLRWVSYVFRSVVGFFLSIELVAFFCFLKFLC